MFIIKENEQLQKIYSVKKANGKEINIFVDQYGKLSGEISYQKKL